MNKFYLPFLFFSLQAAGQPPTPEYSKTAIQSSRYWIDIDYAGDGITGHMLDIHLPTAGEAPFPIVICIYGSAWFSNNSKSTIFYDGLGQRLLKEGFAVVSINHRSSADARFPAQIQDVKAAIRLLEPTAKPSHSIAILSVSQAILLAVIYLH